jgi:hypothetical protein
LKTGKHWISRCIQEFHYSSLVPELEEPVRDELKSSVCLSSSSDASSTTRHESVPIGVLDKFPIVGFADGARFSGGRQSAVSQDDPGRD